MNSRHGIQIALLAFSLVFVMALGGCGGSKPNPDLNLGGIDLSEVFSQMMNRVPKALGSINSQESIDKALEELTSVSLDLDDLIFNSQKLSEKGQLDLSMLALKEAPAIKELAKVVNNSPVLDEKLGSTMDDIVGKLKQLI